jgi:NAD(P)-dependent dehydrogenase (short-subunit alcohol dehydrogenase family)
MKNLENKVIIVTGGGGLLGSSFVSELKKHGGIVINADINLDTDIENGKVACDINDEDSVNSLIEKVKATYGRIDGLVNNAYPRTSDWGLDFELIPLSSWKSNVDMQLNSIFQLCQTTLRLMKSQQFGSIVNIASIYGVVGPDFSIYGNSGMTMPAAYSAIKGGVINFSRYLAAYYGPYNIRVNCISPGGIYNGQAREFVSRYEEKVPLKRMGTPEDISPTVAHLLSDYSSYITGQNIIIDGGWTAI